MTSLAVLRLRPRDAARTGVAIVLFAAWSAAAVTLWLELATIPTARPDLVESAVIYLIPLAAVVTAVLRRRSQDRILPVLAGAMSAVAAAIWLAPQLSNRATAIFAIPAIAGSMLAARRWPAPMLIATVACSAFYGSAQAFLGLPLGQLADLLLGGFWFGLLGGLMLSSRRHAWTLTPGVALIGVYIAITLAYVAASPNFEYGLRFFRLSHWHILALVVVGYVGLRRPTLDRVAKGTIVVAVLVGAYATLRWAIGPAAKEAELIGGAYGTQYNQLFVGENKVQGSFPNGQELGLWASLVIPFCVAAALTRRIVPAARRL